MLFIQMTGLSGAGKSTVANAAKLKLEELGYAVEIIDGDEYRKSLCSDLGFSKKDRNENIRRLGFVGKVLARNGVITFMAAINPYDEVRKELMKGDPRVKVVYVKCDIPTLCKRDPKGLYKRALLPDGDPQKINNFTGISDPYEMPENPDFVLETMNESVDVSADKLVKYILSEINIDGLSCYY